MEEGENSLGGNKEQIALHKGKKKKKRPSFSITIKNRLGRRRQLLLSDDPNARRYGEERKAVTPAP